MSGPCALDERIAEQPVEQRLVADIAPAVAELTDEVPFGQAWARPGLSRRSRSLVTVASLVSTASTGSTEQLPGHLRRAHANGLSCQELTEAITHLAFHAAPPRVTSAVAVARRVFQEEAPER